MNDIIKSIEAEQLKETVDDFRVGDTVKVYAKIKEGNRERVPCSVSISICSPEDCKTIRKKLAFSRETW